MITYVVVRESLNQRSEYDFDDIEDAREWVRQEISFDKNMSVPPVCQYHIFEVENDSI